MENNKVGPTREEMIKMILQAQSTPGRNSMGISESFYNPYYLVNNLLSKENIDVYSLDERQLQLMLMVADYASDVFY